MNLSSSATAFSSLAAGYDQEFGTLHGVSELRSRVFRLVDRYVPPGSAVLELGCGTGEDAGTLSKRGYAVTATDASPGMIEQARSRLSPLGVSVHLLPAEEVADHFPVGAFDALFSNFGALNCVPDLPEQVRRLAALVKPGGVMIFSLLGKYSVWEMLAGGFRLDGRTAVRRLKPGAVMAKVGDHQIRVWYHSLRALTNPSTPMLEIQEIAGLNVISPPPGSSSFVRSHPHMTRFLDILDPVVGRLPALRTLGDHVVVVLRLRGTPVFSAGRADARDH